MVDLENEFQSQLFLVKTQNLILGPYTGKEISQKLKMLEFNGFDEVRSSNVRWLTFKEHPYFNSIWRESQKVKGDLTKTLNFTQSIKPKINVTKDELFEESITSDLHVDLTVTNYQISPSAMAAKAQEELKQQKINNQIIEKLNLENALIEKRKKEKTIKFNIAMISLLFVCSVALYYKFSGSHEKKQSEIKLLLTEARKLKSYGFYSQALDVYSKANQILPLQSVDESEFALLKMKVKDESLEARRVFEKELNRKDISVSELVTNYNWIGLAFLRDDNLTLAEEVLNKALSYKNENLYLDLNLITLKIKQNKFAEAFELSQKAYLKNKYNGFLLFLKSYALVSLLSEDKNTNKFSEIEKTASDLKDYLLRFSYLKSELYLMLTQMYFFQNNLGLVQETILKVIDELPNTKEMYFEPLEVDDSLLNWKNFEAICEKIFSSNNSKEEMMTFRGVCYLNQQKYEDAKRLIDESNKMAPNSAVTVSGLALYNHFLNRKSELLALLKSANNLQSKIISKIRTEICLKEKDLSCVESNYEAMKNFEPHSIYNHFLKSWILTQKKDFQTARTELIKAFDIEKNFIPVNELKLGLDQKNDQK